MHRRRWAHFLIIVLTPIAAPLRAQVVERTFAVRIDGRVVGYTRETETLAEEDGRPVIRFESKSLVKVELLGASIDQHLDQVWILDPKTRATLRLSSRMAAGPTTFVMRGKAGADGFVIDDGSATLDQRQVVIAPDFRWLAERAPKHAGDALDTDYLMPEIGGVQRAHIVLAADPDRELLVLGTTTSARAYEVSVPDLGMELTVLVSKDGFETLRYEVPAQKMVVERASDAIVERIERVDMTSGILVKTNLDIDDPSLLTFVRLQASIDTTKNVTAAMLNVPGQRFDGTVENGRIDGVFEIRPRRLDGSGSPAFPVPASLFAAAELQQYLRPEEAIESDDPGIATQARELAAGAETCFQVVERLSRWTHDNIPYAIPGGGTAKRTFELRSGECAGHSRVLAAMLRSLGIPARTPMGGMYVPLYGGSFAQHMWTEVWLGAAIGWLPVDCTANQPTFIDAGHIRLADGASSFGPKSITVLESEPKTRPATTAAERRTDAFPFAVGEALVYRWTIGGQLLGEERMTYQGKADGGHAFASALDLRAGRLKETTRTVVGDDGRLLTFHVERKVGDRSMTFAVRRDGDQVIVDKKSDDGDRSDVIEAVEPAVFMLHNNCTPHLAIAVARALPLEAGTEARVRMLHDEQRSTFAMTLRETGAEAIEIGGAKVQARVVDVALVGLAIVLHVDEHGRLLRYHQQQGDVTIELQAP